MSKYTYSVWRRKTASAQVRLFKWTWESKINDKKLWDYIQRKDLFDVLLNPLKLTKNKDNFYFEVKVTGSWESAQVQAIASWISKALAEAEPSTKVVLREAGLLTRDARKVERKKPGKKKARKSPTWSKR